MKREWNQSADKVASEALQQEEGVVVTSEDDKQDLITLNRLDELLKPRNDSGRFVGECVDCETGKGRPLTQGESHGNVQATYTFQMIAMNHIPSLPKSFKGNTELLLWIDLFTGYVIAKASALLVQKQRATMAYRPQANGSAERMVQTLTRALKMFVSDVNQQDWGEYAERLTFALNTAQDRTRGDTHSIWLTGGTPGRPWRPRYGWVVRAAEIAIPDDDDTTYKDTISARGNKCARSCVRRSGVVPIATMKPFGHTRSRQVPRYGYIWIVSRKATHESFPIYGMALSGLPK
ncbi:unnamed protein product [Phytophthora fragariaefolia]|uniref:Unnamed protein product n=1 Tax=Phytophthora fragariaefolia TaxID=1490495 RepID=A0A9W7CX10_9STRA|nr:unnamed protein product [Phytophthora fragariaefolia]